MSLRVVYVCPSFREIDELCVELTISAFSLRASVRDMDDVKLTIVCPKGLGLKLPQIDASIIEVDEKEVDSEFSDNDIWSKIPGLEHETRLFLEPNIVVSKDVVALLKDVVSNISNLSNLSRLSKSPHREQKWRVYFGRPHSIYPQFTNSQSRDGLTRVDVENCTSRLISGFHSGATFHVARDSLHMLNLVTLSQRLSSQCIRIPLTFRESRESRAPNYFAYAVTLTSRPERIAHVETLKFAIPHLIIIDAIDGSRLGRRELGELNGFLKEPFVDEFVPGRLITVNQVAAFLSHKRALETFLEESREFSYGVIFEDDVVLYDDFQDTLNSTIREMSEWDIDVVQMYLLPLQRNSVRPVTLSLKFPSDKELVPSGPGTWGMQTYVVSRKGAKKLLDGLETMRGSVDEQLSRIEGLNLFAYVGPNVLEEDTKNAPSVTNSRPRTVAEVMS